MSKVASVLPVHLGLILDGNRRWAKAKGLPSLEGHRQGYDNLKDIAKAAIESGVKYVSAYIFSTDNWNRTPKEVKYLMELAYKMLTRDVAELNEENIRVLWLGSPERVSKKLLGAIRSAEESTKSNTSGTLCICFNYGGIQELVDATKQIVASKVDQQNVTQKLLQANLYKPDVPEIDLLIRTSGEQRISGFMLYRAAYAELLFVDTFWPDFSREHLMSALEEYKSRQRRFGA